MEGKKSVVVVLLQSFSHSLQLFLSHCERNKVLNEVRFLRIMKLAVKPRILRNTSSSSFAAKKCYQKWLFVVCIFCEVRVHLSLVPLFVRAC